MEQKSEKTGEQPSRGNSQAKRRKTDTPKIYIEHKGSHKSQYVEKMKVIKANEAKAKEAEKKKKKYVDKVTGFFLLVLSFYLILENFINL